MTTLQVQYGQLTPSQIVTIKTNDIKTVEELKTSVIKQLKIEEKDSHNLEFSITGFLIDAISLEKPDQKLEDLAITKDHVLFVRIVPPLSAFAPHPKEKGVLGGDKSDSVSEEEDEEKKYKGITASNCLSLYQKEKQGSKRQLLLLSFIENHLEELQEEIASKEIKPSTMKAILSSEKLNIEEEALFDIVTSWGKNQGGELKSVVSDLLPLIRFPLFSTAKLGAKVAPSGLLDSGTLLALFSYASKPQDEKKLPEDFPYSAKPREGGSPPCKWDVKNKEDGITIQDEKTQSILWPSYDSIIRGTRCFKGKDKYYWEIEWTGSNSLRIGVLDETVTTYKHDLWQVGWAVLGKGGSGTYRKGATLNGSLESYNTGDICGLALDMSKRQVVWYRNGRRVGVVFDDLPEKVWAAVSNGTGTTSIKTRWGLPYPKDA